MEQDKFVKLLKKVVREVVREEIEMALNKVVLNENKKIEFLEKSPVSTKETTIEDKKSLMKRLGLDPDELKRTTPIPNTKASHVTDPVQQMLLETAQEGKWRNFEI